MLDILISFGRFTYQPNLIFTLQAYILNEDAFSNYKDIKMTSAAILEPRDKSDVTLKFTAGLVLALPFTAVIENVHDIRNIRIKVR